MRNLKRSFSLATLFLFLFSCNGGVVETEQAPSNEAEYQKIDSEALPCSYEKISLTKRSPQNINEVTDLINELPKPLDLQCFLKSLARPLKVNLTLSSLSAQPAVGRTSPRVFIFYNQLVLSVAPEGKGAKLLEVSFMYTDSTSLKGEYEFPITDSNISYQTPFDRIATDPSINSAGTTCQACHSGETLDNSISEANAFTSVAIKPASNMNLSSFKLENTKCELANLKDYRCRLINAIFKDQDVDSVDFPNGTPEFIDTL